MNTLGKWLVALSLALFAPLAFAATAISMDGLVQLIIYLLVLGAVMGLLLFIIGKVDPPEPLGKWLPIVVYVLGALILIFMLLSFVGSPVFVLR